MNVLQINYKLNQSDLLIARVGYPRSSLFENAIFFN